MRKSTKKQQSQVQTIQRTVTSRNATQDNGNINNFCEGNRWFYLQYLRTFCYFSQQNQDIGCLVKYIRVQEFKYRPVPIDQVFCTRCMLCLLQSTIPATSAARVNHTKSAKHIANSHVFFQTRTHLH